MSLPWVLFYEDGSEFSSSDGNPEESPLWGLVLAAQPYHESAHLYVGDYFVYHDGRWFNHDLTGLIDLLVNNPQSVKCFRVGRYVANEVYDDILKRSQEYKF